MYLGPPGWASRHGPRPDGVRPSTGNSLALVGVEAAGVEPASANGSYGASTCVASLSRFARSGERAAGSRTSCRCVSSSARTALTSDQPDSSTPRRPASGRQVRRRAANLGYAANARSVLAIVIPPGVLRGPGNLGTLLHPHQTRRSRDAPSVCVLCDRPFDRPPRVSVIGRREATPPPRAVPGGRPLAWRSRAILWRSGRREALEVSECGRVGFGKEPRIWKDCRSGRAQGGRATGCCACCRILTRNRAVALRCITWMPNCRTLDAARFCTVSNSSSSVRRSAHGRRERSCRHCTGIRRPETLEPTAT